VVSFFESPAATEFLHQVSIAAHLVMTLVGPGGIRYVCQFFELSGLSPFIASSYGAQHGVSVQMEEAIT